MRRLHGNRGRCGVGDARAGRARGARSGGVAQPLAVVAFRCRGGAGRGGLSGTASTWRDADACRRDRVARRGDAAERPLRGAAPDRRISMGAAAAKPPRRAGASRFGPDEARRRRGSGPRSDGTRPQCRRTARSGAGAPAGRPSGGGVGSSFRGRTLELRCADLERSGGDALRSSGQGGQPSTARRGIARRRHGVASRSEVGRSAVQPRADRGAPRLAHSGPRRLGTVPGGRQREPMGRRGQTSHSGSRAGGRFSRRVHAAIRSADPRSRIGEEAGQAVSARGAAVG